MAMKGALDEEGVPIKSGPGKKMPQHVCLLIKIRDFNVFCLSICSFDLLIMYTLLLNWKNKDMFDQVIEISIGHDIYHKVILELLILKLPIFASIIHVDNASKF